MQTLHHTEDFKYYSDLIKNAYAFTITETPLTHCCAPVCTALLRGTIQHTLLISKCAIVCLTLAGIFSIIVSSFILAWSSCSPDCNASERMNPYLHVASLNATVPLIQTPEVRFWRGRGEIHGSIAPLLKESFLCKSDYLPLQWFFTGDHTPFTGGKRGEKRCKIYGTLLTDQSSYWSF